jgi:flagellar basal-body rod modification protein FlgD
MLTTQMENQDPLNPLDSTDFALQLATFSGVEQQVQTNTLLSGMSGLFGQMTLSQLSGWLGKEALSTAPVAFDGSAITLVPDPAPLADGTTLVVTDAQGAVLARETIPLGAKTYQWLGAGPTGDPLAAGTYNLRLESRTGDTVIATTPIAAYARVEEARLDGQTVRLRLPGGVEVAASDIRALRDG